MIALTLCGLAALYALAMLGDHVMALFRSDA